MNNLILFLHTEVKKRKRKAWRVFAVSGVASLFAVVLVVTRMGDNKILLLIMYIVVSAIQVILLYGKTCWVSLFFDVVTYYVIACILSGGILFLRHILGERAGSFYLILCFSNIAYVVLRWMISYFHRFQKQMQHSIPIRIGFRGKRIEGVGYVDTGNQLREPISGELVSVVDYSFVETFFNEKEKAYVKEIAEGKMTSSSGELLTRLIPFHSIGKKSGILVGFQAENLQMLESGKWKKKEKPWLGISMENIASGGGYQMLLNDEILLDEKGI